MIPKLGKPQNEFSSYRPISLLTPSNFEAARKITIENDETVELWDHKI